MRRAAGVLYWFIVGVLTIVGIYFSVLHNLPPYFFLAALVLTVLGAWWPGPGYSWVALVGFGGLPAIVLSANVLGEVARADWSCSKISFKPGTSYAYDGSSGETVYCSTIPGQLFVAAALFWAITLLGVVALVLLLRHHRPQADSRVTPSGLMGLGVVLLLIVGASASYVVVKAPLTPQAGTDLPPDEPPLPALSCPDYLEEEIAAFEGSGDRVTPAFETTGHYWGFEYASTGYGSIRIKVLAETGEVVYDSDEPSVQADSVGSAEFALGPGTFRLKIDADDDVKYAVLVCEEADPSGRNQGSTDEQSNFREHPLPPKAGVKDPDRCPDFGSCAAPTNDEPVSDVVGMKPEEACATLDQSGYRGVFAGGPVDDPAKPGRVVGQHPPPGSKDCGGRLVQLLVSRPSSERPLEPPRGCVNSPG